jgi:hypothetical protein
MPGITFVAFTGSVKVIKREMPQQPRFARHFSTRL